jgi:hypothetical protein
MVWSNLIDGRLTIEFRGIWKMEVRRRYGERKHATMAEVQILDEYLGQYWADHNRSPARKAIITRALRSLEMAGYGSWTKSRVRLWLNNNKCAATRGLTRTLDRPFTDRAAFEEWNCGAARVRFPSLSGIQPISPYWPVLLPMPDFVPFPDTRITQHDGCCE